MNKIIKISIWSSLYYSYNKDNFDKYWNLKSCKQSERFAFKIMTKAGK